MALTSQLVKDEVSLSASAIAAVKIDELDHRSSEVMLLKCESHVSCMSTGSSLNLGRMRLAVISKPRSEGVPVAGDVDDERYVVHLNCSFASRDDTNNSRTMSAEHDNHSIKIRVPLVNDVWVIAINDSGVQMIISWVLRLFWLMI